MSIYRDMRERDSKCFKISVTSQNDPCHTCIVKDEKSKIHCEDCKVKYPNNPFSKPRKNRENKSNLNYIDALQIIL